MLRSRSNLAFPLNVRLIALLEKSRLRFGPRGAEF